MRNLEMHPQKTSGFILFFLINNSDINYYINSIDGIINKLYGIKKSGLQEELDERVDLFASERTELIHEIFKKKYDLNHKQNSEIKKELLFFLTESKDSLYTEKKSQQPEDKFNPEVQISGLMTIPAKKKVVILIQDLKPYKENGFNKILIEYGYIPIPLKTFTFPDGTNYDINKYLNKRDYYFFKGVICPTRKTIKLNFN